MANRKNEGRRIPVKISAKNPGVSGSCTVVNINDGDIKFIVDCGSYTEPGKALANYEEFDFEPSDVSFALITHAHGDHIGRLPLLYKRGFEGKTYSTVDTNKILTVVLRGNIHILSKEAEELNQTVLYDSHDVSKTLKNVKTYKFEESFSPCPGIEVTFYKNAHLIGAAIIVVKVSLEGYEDTNIVFTGDYKEKNIFFDVNNDLPDSVTKLPTIIVTESTYGDKDSGEIIPVFETDIINQLNNVNKIVIFAFSLERAQIALWKLHEMQKAGILDENVMIYLDGKQAQDFTTMYKHSFDIKAELKNFVPEKLVNITKPDIRKNTIFGLNKGKCICITTSGMADYGWAKTYVENLIDREDVCFYFIGYTSPGTLGNELINSKKRDIVHIGEMQKSLSATVLATNEYSGHSTRDGLIKFFKQFLNLNAILITHGNPDVKNSFKQYCIKNFPDSEVIILADEDFY